MHSTRAFQNENGGSRDIPPKHTHASRASPEHGNNTQMASALQVENKAQAQPVSQQQLAFDAPLQARPPEFEDGDDVPIKEQIVEFFRRYGLQCLGLTWLWLFTIGLPIHTVTAGTDRDVVALRHRWFPSLWEQKNICIVEYQHPDTFKRMSESLDSTDEQQKHGNAAHSQQAKKKIKPVLPLLDGTGTNVSAEAVADYFRTQQEIQRSIDDTSDGAQSDRMKIIGPKELAENDLRNDRQLAHKSATLKAHKELSARVAPYRGVVVGPSTLDQDNDDVNGVPAEKPIRTPMQERLIAWCLRNIPRTLTWMTLDDCGENGHNSIKYNRLLYKVRRYHSENQSLVVVEKNTADGLAKVKFMCRIAYCTEVPTIEWWRFWFKILPRWTSSHRRNRYGNTHIEYVTRDVLKNWISSVPVEFVESVPERRLSEYSESLVEIPPRDLLQSVQIAESMDADAAAAAEDLAKAQQEKGTQDIQLTAEQQSFLEGSGMDREEKVRRILSALISDRLHGDVLLKDMTWWMEITRLGGAQDESEIGDLFSSENLRKWQV